MSNNSKNQIAEMMSRINRMKKGKTFEQIKVIDFFYNTASGGGCGCLSSRPDVMSLNEYMDIVQKRCDGLNTRNMAIEKIGLDESQIQEISPIALSSFVFDDEAVVKVADMVAVSNKFAITWIFFSDTQMYTYTYVFDTMSDDTDEITKDFFYTDITCLTTRRKEKENIDIFSASGCFSDERIVKNNYVIDTFEIVVPGGAYSFSMRKNESFEKSLKAAKSQLREKKYYTKK